VGDVIEHEFQLEFVGEADGSFEIARAFGGEHDGLLAVEIGEQGF
jgi:hypothetical protein